MGRKKKEHGRDLCTIGLTLHYCNASTVVTVVKRFMFNVYVQWLANKRE